MLRLLICGGRDFWDKNLMRDWMFEAIDTWRAESKEARYASIDWSDYSWVTAIHGGARGADSLAGSVAADCRMTTEVYPISNEDWSRYGNGAGPRRNAEMLIKSNPNYGLIAPGGNGTNHMASLLLNVGIPCLDKRGEGIRPNPHRLPPTKGL